MRSFEERKAEIFRRSKQRINRRVKTRKRITLYILPMIICSLIASAFILPDMILEDNKNRGEEKTSDSLISKAVSVEVKLIGETKIFKDKDDIGKLSEAVTSLEKNEAVYQGLNSELSGIAAYQHTSSTGQFQIVFNLSSGEKVTYRFGGGILYNKKTNSIYNITDNEEKRLKAIIGI